MNRPQEDPSLRRTLNGGRLIVLALAAGVVIFALAAFIFTRGGEPMGGPGFASPFLLSLGVLGAALVGAYPAVRKAMIAYLRRTSAGEPSTAEVTALFVRVTIVGAAMAEAFCLFSLITYLVTGNELGLLAAAVGLAVLLWFLPSETRWARFREAASGRGPV